MGGQDGPERESLEIYTKACLETPTKEITWEAEKRTISSQF